MLQNKTVSRLSDATDKDAVIGKTIRSAMSWMRRKEMISIFYLVLMLLWGPLYVLYNDALFLQKTYELEYLNVRTLIEITIEYVRKHVFHFTLPFIFIYL